jgi:hypothetical protein
MSQIGAFWEISAEWAESGKEEPIKIVWRHIHCLDPNLEDRGFGVQSSLKTDYGKLIFS